MCCKNNRRDIPCTRMPGSPSFYHMAMSSWFNEECALKRTLGHQLAYTLYWTLVLGCTYLYMFICRSQKCRWRTKFLSSWCTMLVGAGGTYRGGCGHALFLHSPHEPVHMYIPSASLINIYNRLSVIVCWTTVRLTLACVCVLVQLGWVGGGAEDSEVERDQPPEAEGATDAASRVS